MSTTIDAKFDGEVFRPIGTISLPPDTTVRLTVEAIPEPVAVEPILGEPYSFLRMAQELNLEGPPDWATNFESFPHGRDAEDAG